MKELRQDKYQHNPIKAINIILPNHTHTYTNTQTVVRKKLIIILLNAKKIKVKVKSIFEDMFLMIIKDDNFNLTYPCKS